MHREVNYVRDNYGILVNWSAAAFYVRDYVEAIESWASIIGGTQNSYI